MLMREFSVISPRFVAPVTGQCSFPLARLTFDGWFWLQGSPAEINALTLLSFNKTAL